MKITKTVGYCICCKIDMDVSNWGFGTLKNGENPVVDIYRKTVNDDGSVEKLHDFKIFSNGVIKVGPESLLDYNEIVNGSNKSYLQYIMDMVDACKAFSLSEGFSKENRIALGNAVKDELLTISNVINRYLVPHNTVQIDDEIYIPPDISFREIGLIVNLQNSGNDRGCKIDGDDRTVVGKIIYELGGKTTGYILNDGGIILTRDIYFDAEPFKTMVTFKTMVIRSMLISNHRRVNKC